MKNIKLEKNLFYYLCFLVTSFFFIFLLDYTIRNYNISPLEIYEIDTKNLIEDGSFENFNETAGDCCNAEPNKSRVFASKAKNAYEGNYSLNLTAEYQCACIAKEIKEFNFSNKYYISFYYRGENPKVCLFDSGLNKCIINDNLNSSDNWGKYENIGLFKEKSLRPLIHVYTNLDSSEKENTGLGSRTNFYDSLVINKLNKISKKYENNKSYILKTNTDYIVNGKLIYINKDKKEAYFILKGRSIIHLHLHLSFEDGLIILLMLNLLIFLNYKHV